MADPITLAAAGAGIGALIKPNNPLQGAMLGGMAGFTGGTALGIGGATTAVGGGTGLAAGAGEGIGLTTAGAGGGATGLTAANTATGLGIGNAGTSSALGLSAVPETSGYLLANTAATPTALAPTFMERLGMAGKSAYENPMMTGQALSATQGLLTPDQQPQIQAAPAMPVQKGPGLKPFDPMASMDPYKQSVIGGQPISLI